MLRYREKPALRRNPRVEEGREAVLEVSGKRRAVTLVDLSQSGALVDVKGGVLSRGQPVSLEIIGSRGEPLMLDGTVHARRGRRLYVLQFDGMDEAVRVDLVWDLYVHPHLDRAETVYRSADDEKGHDEVAADDGPPPAVGA